MPWTPITYADNKDIIDLCETGPTQDASPRAVHLALLVHSVLIPSAMCVARI